MQRRTRFFSALFARWYWPACLWITIVLMYILIFKEYNVFLFVSAESSLSPSKADTADPAFVPRAEVPLSFAPPRLYKAPGGVGVALSTLIG